MKRREFIIKGVSAGVVTGTSLGLGGITGLASALPPQNAYDLVAVRDGEPDVMFDRAIASLGGMTKYVKKGQKVVVKPNIGWDVIPERAGNTNPKLVGRIVKHCLEAGASEVYVFDNTCDAWNLCYKNSGIEKAVKDAGGKLVPGNTENYYQSVQIPKGKRLKEARVHELILNSDVFINVPVLKHHSSASISLAMKNLMGVVWDRRYWHRNDLHQCIADFVTWRKPTLNVIDGYRVMLRNGPRGVSEADVVMMKQLIVSADIVAADAAATLVFGSKPQDIPHIRIANEMKLGTMDLSRLNINRIKI
ncbi:DUF362 domain-containing protein [Lentimicrobium sp.]|jgi:uncharacterized protein (DUF362 family)|uniref:DUF362 domain-containing protein n=1 Tax=Lentimicrobium sp. TaxID=2034841 RepID=UPI0025E352CD|nr:DUF362 domain-containing protein [Lentimicrobium sp.]MCO5258276.1 DUF362 domain-containing protein [Lentimicrobium sp.]MCO5262522.1 DUF362 domain-containing protein [Lentimicrobium sp.]HOP12578.1 DUF362 domain-containing protein [Lentimicrobium sp.]HPF64585.1 DUF362 domain-containing protein [Lentimicrobium sp.]HPJ62665.1 DUF362 domain-containing protein [Lentimicrobium sp.]